VYNLNIDVDGIELDHCQSIPWFQHLRKWQIFGKSSPPNNDVSASIWHATLLETLNIIIYYSILTIISFEPSLITKHLWLVTALEQVT
jgi:hypothetical protein